VWSWATLGFLKGQFTVPNKSLTALCVGAYYNCVNASSFKSFRKIVKSDFQLLRFCLSVIPHGCLRVFLKSVEEIHCGLQSEKNQGYCVWRPMFIYCKILLKSFLESKAFQTKFVEKIKTHFHIRYFFLTNRAVFEIMCKLQYTDTSANEDNSFQNHILWPKSSLAETWFP